MEGAGPRGSLRRQRCGSRMTATRGERLICVPPKPNKYSKASAIEPHTMRLNLPPNGSMLQIAFQGVDPVGMTQFLQCLVLYLANPFTGHVELIAEFFQCVFGNRIDAEA